MHNKSVFTYSYPTQNDRAELKKTDTKAMRMTEIYGDPLKEEGSSEEGTQNFQLRNEKNKGERKADHTLSVNLSVFITNKYFYLCRVYSQQSCRVN